MATFSHGLTKAASILVTFREHFVAETPQKNESCGRQKYYRGGITTTNASKTPSMEIHKVAAAPQQIDRKADRRTGLGRHPSEVFFSARGSAVPSVLVS